ncbi:MAG: UDP-N-acetylmuramoyl-tripeptide--D-alanyl-D-alanine ligase [Lachnospiraceae bacterium]
MKNMTIRHLVKASGGTYFGPEEKLDQEITGVVKDNREVKSGNLFVPFKGAKVDGHDFIGQAYAAGAAVVLSEQDLSDRLADWKVGEDFAYIKVASCPQALKDLAAYYRQQLSCTIIGVVGSVGKTSTKEMIASVLGTKYRVQKTAGNFNNEIGLPLTIFSIREEHEVAIVEMGISEFGEMERLARIAVPDMAVMTNIGNCHLEKLGDRDGVLKEKSEVIRFIKDGGTLVLNLDDDKLSTIDVPQRLEGIGYCVAEKGAVPDVTAYATDVHSRGIDAETATFHIDGKQFTATIPMSGVHNVYNALAAVCIGNKMGLTIEQMKQGIESVGEVEGRNRRISCHGYTVVDDCYNANPASMRAALCVLAKAPGRKIAVLGDMGELGTQEKQLHYEVGTFAAQCGIDLICCIGELAKEIAEGAKEQGALMRDGGETGTGHKDGGNPAGAARVLEFASVEEFLKDFAPSVKEGDTILVKASHFMKFTGIVEALTK